MLPSKILIPVKNGAMRFELRIEVIDASGNALNAKKLVTLKRIALRE